MALEFNRIIDREKWPCALVIPIRFTVSFVLRTYVFKKNTLEAEAVPGQGQTYAWRATLLGARGERHETFGLETKAQNNLLWPDGEGEGAG